MVGSLDTTAKGGWQLRTRTLSLTPVPRIMGILNVTPDSFSDGGAFTSHQVAVDRALRIEDEGADILDIGGESTRPYADRVAIEDELSRVVPVIEQLDRRLGIPISIDTSKAAVARAALDLGAEIVNDVTALAGDAAMVPLVVERKPGVCLMHMRGTPQNMQDDPRYEDVVGEILAYLRSQLEQAIEQGIERPRICLDPGIGFGKTHEHNLQLLREAERFLALGQPILVGHSRKGFVGNVLEDKEADRTYGTLGVSLALAAKGIHILRVHDVAATVQALKLFRAAGGC